jgi:hypothetical protein
VVGWWPFENVDTASTKNSASHVEHVLRGDGTSVIVPSVVNWFVTTSSCPADVP